MKRRDLSTASEQLRFMRPMTLVPPLSLGPGLLYGLEGLRTLSSIIGIRVWTIMKLSLRVAGRKFCLRSRRTLSLRDPAIERKAARNLAKKSNNVVGKPGGGKLFDYFVKDKACRRGMRFQNLVKPNNWILKIAFGLWISWESGTKAASSMWQWTTNFSFLSQGDPIFITAESGLTPHEIPDEERHHELIKSPECVGVFVRFTVRWMTWVIPLRGKVGMGILFERKSWRSTSFPFFKTLKMFWMSLRLPFCTTKHWAWKRFEPRTFWWTTTSTSLVMKSCPVILLIWMPVKTLDPFWRMSLKKGCCLNLLQLDIVVIKWMSTSILCFGEWSSTWSFLSHLCLSYPAHLQAVCDAIGGNTQYWACEHRPTIKCATYRCFHFFPIMLSLPWGGGLSLFDTLYTCQLLNYK